MSVIIAIALEQTSFAQTDHGKHRTPEVKNPQPSPTARPQREQMPAASPTAQASPQQKMEMNMPMPQASPSPGTPDKMKGMENMPGTDTPNTGSPLVMSGKDMAIRLGASDSNVMVIGQMGSGTAWQPISTQMYMVDRVMGKWLFDVPLQPGRRD